MKHTKRILWAMMMSLGLSACGSMDDFAFWRADKPEPCSRVFVSRDVASVTKFAPGPGRDLIDVTYEAEIRDVLSACDYDVDYTTREGEITAQVAPVIEARRGPANQDGKAELSYFVAIVDDERQIQNKKVFPLTMGFPGNLTVNRLQDEPVTLTIKTDGNKDAADYTIHVGFQLNREEALYNRKLNAR